MGKFRVLERSFINNSIAEEGAIVEYGGKPGKNLEPVDDAAVQASATAAAGEIKGVSVEDLTRQKVAAIGGAPDAIDVARTATAAAQAAEAALQGKTVSVDGVPVSTPQPTTEPVATPAGADGLV